MDFIKHPKSKVGHLRKRRGQQLYRQLLNNATCSLTFSKEVILEMGLDSVPYSQADFKWLFNASGNLSPRASLRSTRLKTVKRMPFNPSPHDPAKTKSFPDPPFLLPALKNQWKSVTQLAPLTAKDYFTLPSHQGGLLESFKSTQLQGECLKAAYTGDREDGSKTFHWDEIKLKKPISTTAQWINSQKILNRVQSKTQELPRGQCGSASATDVVSEEDLFAEQDLPKQTEKQQPLRSSRAGIPLLVYYRVQGSCLPSACSKSGALNQTVNTVVKHIETPQPPRPQDILKPCAGGHVFSENKFKQEPFSGIAKQVHQHDPRNHDRNNSEYQKNLQETFPCGPDNWTKASPATMHSERERTNEGTRRLEKGARRWVDLPTAAAHATEEALRPPDYSGRKALYNPTPELPSLRYAVEGWRSAWKMKNTWQNATTEGLRRELTDLHHHVRMSAIATCASGALNRPREEQHPPDAGQYGHVWDIQAVPQELQPLILRALEDPVKRVQMAAAVCQYAMGTPGSRAREILRRELCQDATCLGADSWVAAQCLAMEGDDSRPVIQRLLSQHLVSGTHSDQEQSASLLASISSKTTLVRSLLAEDLNCANWRTRLLACKTISLLKSPTNKDLANKLVHLMWNDWSGEVRQMAAHALGKLGAERTVHNGLRDKLEEDTASSRVEALILVGQLQIMTAKLLPAFLRCFNDNFVSVRKQACVTAAALMMKDSLVLNQLIHLMKNDPAWEVKVAAISASGTIGCLTPTLQDLLLWALHHEEVAQVRIAACEAMKVLRVKGPELQHLLQECFVLEPDLQVHRHIEGLLKNYGYSLEGVKGMVHKIKDQIQRLSTKSIITSKVLLGEELEDMYRQRRKYLGDESQTDTPPVLQLLQEHYKGTKHYPSTIRLSCSSDSSGTQSSDCTQESNPVNQFSSSAHQDHQNSTSWGNCKTSALHETDENIS